MDKYYKNQFMFNETDIILAVYRALISYSTPNGIPVNLRPAHVVGTVQDDPFDCWVEEILKKRLSNRFEVFHAGQLTTPDLVLRDKETGYMIGVEIKKLILEEKGKDPRGLTLDYNSCLPCGQALIKVGGETEFIPCYYLFALLSQDSERIITLAILDGDFLNFKTELYIEAKHSNYTEYGHGPYGEGSVRHRKMYTYPNPLNTKLDFFYSHQVLVLKKRSLEKREEEMKYVKAQIIRADTENNLFFYYLIDETTSIPANTPLVTLEDIFKACKTRKPKERVPYMINIPKLDEA